MIKDYSTGRSIQFIHKQHHFYFVEQPTCMASVIFYKFENCQGIQICNKSSTKTTAMTQHLISFLKLHLTLIQMFVFLMLYKEEESLDSVVCERCFRSQNYNSIPTRLTQDKLNARIAWSMDTCTVYNLT